MMADEPELPDEFNDEAVSKSERKRQMHRLQALGEELTQLSQRQLDELALNPALDDAIRQTANIKKREALRRHMQFIGKLMRKEDDASIAHIEHFLDKIKQVHQKSTATLHRIESWRDRILSGDPSEIENFLQEFPQGDRQWLRQIQRQHQQEIQHNKPPAAARKLFRYIRDFVNA